jgi:hypothetical protein
VNPNDGLKEQSICHSSSVIAHSTHGHDSRECCSHVCLVLFRYEREHNPDFASFQGCTRGANHRTIKRVAMRRHFAHLLAIG